MMTLFNILEGRAESGKGSKEGREKYSSKEGATKRGAVKSKKSRVRIYATIAKALHQEVLRLRLSLKVLKHMQLEQWLSMGA